MSENPRTLVAVATYNEIENLPRLIDEIFHYAPRVDLLVVDDGSPDGTGRWCDERAAVEKRLHVMHREAKLGLGTATLSAIRYAIEHDYEVLLTLDADFSHPPRYIPELLQALQRQGDESIDVVIGSRYVKGGSVEGWPLPRRWMSRLVNVYARWMLGLPVRDCSGAFRCFRVALLKQIDLGSLHSQGYSFLEEILWSLSRRNARFAETPIQFVNRRTGRSKINFAEAVSAVWVIFRLGLASRLARIIHHRGHRVHRESSRHAER